MELTFLYSPGFVREWNRQRLTDLDLQALEAAIGKAPCASSDSRGWRTKKDTIRTALAAHGQKRIDAGGLCVLPGKSRNFCSRDVLEE